MWLLSVKVRLGLLLLLIIRLPVNVPPERGSLPSTVVLKAAISTPSTVPDIDKLPTISAPESVVEIRKVLS